MRSLPPFATQDRVTDAVLVVCCGIAQAAALAVAAFATRAAFAALHSGALINIQTIGALAMSGIVVALCLFFSRRIAEGLGQSYANALRQVLYRQIASLPKSRHAERRLGALSLRFVGDLAAARLWFGRGLPDVLTAVVVLPGAVAILFALDANLARAGLLPLGVALALMTVIACHLERRHQQLRKRRAGIAIAMIERIAIAPELDLMGRTDKELRRLNKQGAALRADAVARRARTAGLQAALQTGTAIAALAMLWTASHGDAAPATVAAGLSVLGLITIPLQDLGAAWDRYCAWRVAREKALRLLNETTVTRPAQQQTTPVGVRLCGQIGDTQVAFAVTAGSTARLSNPHGATLARAISGLETIDGVEILFDGGPVRPRVSYIGDAHAGLQGSLRRSACLSTRKRPKDTKIIHVLSAFGLTGMLDHPAGLDQRVSENGKALTAAETLRLDLVRAVLGRSALVVISSVRWFADPDREALLATLHRLSSATIIVAEPADRSNPAKNAKAL